MDGTEFVVTEQQADLMIALLTEIAQLQRETRDWLAAGVAAAEDDAEEPCSHPEENRVQTAARWRNWTCGDCGYQYVAES